MAPIVVLDGLRRGSAGCAVRRDISRAFARTGVKDSVYLVHRSHSVTGNVRSGKVRQYTIFHWLLKKVAAMQSILRLAYFAGHLVKVCNWFSIRGRSLILLCYEKTNMARQFLDGETFLVIQKLSMKTYQNNSPVYAPSEFRGKKPLF